MIDFEQQVARVKEVAISWFARLGSAPISPSQSFLLVNNRLVGVRFLSGTLRAEWLIAPGEIRVYQNGELAGIEPLESTPPVSVSRAA